jgi:hypothetical protein
VGGGEEGEGREEQIRRRGGRWRSARHVQFEFYDQLEKICVCVCVCQEVIYKSVRHIVVDY